ncbi:hypothetical protein EXIGLDRAFT_620996, partial [Exidia glandulosa HHB12029]
VLAGIERRRKLLDAPIIEGVTSDECCKVRGMITSTLPDAEINLDTFHFVKRYTDSLAGGKKNACRGAIAKDITESVIELRANKRDGVLTKYWPKEEQVARLSAAWAKWSVHKHLWQASAAKVHEDQLNHVKNGCLARARNDIASDGSRIESSHKGWNSLMRSHASGLEMLTALGHDFVLRRNIRIASDLGESSPFAASTYGCHHVMLVDDIARKWNGICSRRASAIHALPMLQAVDSGESFGLAWTEYTSLAPAIKKELADTFVFEVDADYQDGIEFLDSRRLAPIFQAPAIPRVSATPQPRMTASATPQPRSTMQPSVTTGPPAPTYHLTRSERLYKRATGADPAALKFNDEEYFAFANFRVEHQLRTHEMTPAKIVKFTRQFNATLRAGSVHKDPRAILSMLLTLEEKVLERLHTGDYICGSGTDTFWKKQCEGFTITSAAKAGTETKGRKPAVCRRCERLMYPFGKGGQGNHSRDCCSDGAPQKLKDAVPWPQPDRIFINGKRFDASAFFNALATLDGMLNSGTEKPLEYERFWDMVSSRVIIADGKAYFKLFSDLEVIASQTHVVQVVDSQNVLCLGPTPVQPVSHSS